MDVATIITNIKSQSLTGNTGAPDDDAKILRYVNNGYIRIISRAIQLYPGFFRKFIDVTVTDGVAIWPYSLLKILSVADTGNNNARLTAKSLDEIQETDFGLTAVGNPAYYEEIMNGLVTYPRNSTTLNVGCVLMPPLLTADTQEIDIQIPVPYHECIQWVAQKMMAFDERDKVTGLEIQFTDAEFDELISGYLMFLWNKLPAEKRRVKAAL